MICAVKEIVYLKKETLKLYPVLFGFRQIYHKMSTVIHFSLRQNQTVESCRWRPCDSTTIGLLFIQSSDCGSQQKIWESVWEILAFQILIGKVVGI